MVLDLFVGLTIVNDQVRSNGARFSHKEARATMKGIVPVFIFLEEASIYALLDLALDLVDLVSWGGVRTPSYHRPLKLWFDLEVRLDHFFARQGWGQCSKNLLLFPDELTKTRVKVHALQFLNKILLGVAVALSFFLFLHAPHSFGGQLILPVLATLLDIVKGVYQGCLRIGESHLLNTLLGPHRWYPGPLEQVQAGPLLDTLSLSP